MSSRFSPFQNTARTASRTFAIGDIHGCASELEALLLKINPRANDTIVFLGDYVDRGPHSRRVIDIILELSSRFNVVALKGNHEAMFLDFLEHPESLGAGLFILNGGSITLENYVSPDGGFEIPDTHLRFLHELKLFHETETHFFVHAGVPEQPLAETVSALGAPEATNRGAADLTLESPQDLTRLEMQFLWMRQPFLSSSYKWEKMVVHGHTPVAQAEVHKNRINLDSGCVYDRMLTALELPAMKFHKVKRGAQSQAPLFQPPIERPRGAKRFPGRLPVLAGRPGEKHGRYQTLNYNQYGLLIEEVDPNQSLKLSIQDRIEGTIGGETAAGLEFSGRVVRSEGRGERMVYGIQLDILTNGDQGREWINKK